MTEINVLKLVKTIIKRKGKKLDYCIDVKDEDEITISIICDVININKLIDFKDVRCDSD